jgi:HPt (histidine-containing phosphotransfer) domain-containing protein
MMLINPTKISELKELDDDGSDTVLKELIGLYLDSTPPKLKKMSDSFAARDFVTVRKEAHSLRSSSLTLGAETLSQFASEIEYAKEDGSTATTLEVGILNAAQEFEKVKSELKKLL